MAQTISKPDFGAKSERVLDVLTPLTGTAAPAVNADFIGQVFVDTTAKNVYMSVATDSETPANDWVEVSPVA